VKLNYGSYAQRIYKYWKPPRIDKEELTPLLLSAACDKAKKETIGFIHKVVRSYYFQCKRSISPKGIQHFFDRDNAYDHVSAYFAKNITKNLEKTDRLLLEMCELIQSSESVILDPETQEDLKPSLRALAEVKTLNEFLSRTFIHAVLAENDEKKYKPQDEDDIKKILEVGYTFTSDGKSTITYKDSIKDIEYEMHGFYCHTSPEVYLIDGDLKAKYGDETVVRKGNLTIPDLGLFGSGEYTIEGKRHWRGNFKNDTPNGYGVATYEDGFHYEGFFENGCWHGWGKLIVPCESGEAVYVGQWRYGKKHGRGKQVNADGSSYSGQWKKDCFHGRGKAIAADQNSYEGEWRNGRFYGRGTRVFANGSSFVGQWKNGIPNGLGTYRNAEGEVIYVGVWRDGKIRKNNPDGKAVDRVVRSREQQKSEVVIYLDGGAYFGEMRNGLKHGKGKTIAADGYIFDGMFHKGKPLLDGNAYIVYPDGEKYCGELLDGIPHGWGRITFADGKVCEGIWEDGIFTENGYCYIVQPCEAMYRGQLSNNKPHGFGIYMSLNGREPYIRKGNWENGTLSGTGECILFDGTSLRGLFQNGALVGRGDVTWFDGRKGEGEFKDGELIFVSQNTEQDKT
jgi:hypothetical protein